MDSIPQNKTHPLIAVDDGKEIPAEIKDMLLGLVIEIMPNGYWVTFPEKGLSDKAIQGLNMFIGPAEFPINIVERISVFYHHFVSKSRDLEALKTVRFIPTNLPPIVRIITATSISIFVLLK